MNNQNTDDLYRLERLSCDELMRLQHHSVARKSPSGTFYVCPFHGETDASFLVMPPGEDGKQGWVCFGCGKKGSGAVDLMAAFLGKDRKKELKDVLKSLAELFGEVLDGKDYNDSYHRAEPADEVSDEMRYTYREWTDNDVAALGCSVQQVFVREKKNGSKPGERGWKALLDENGNPVKKYSWGHGFDDPACRVTNFDVKSVERMFGVRAVDHYISQAKWNEKQQKMMSWKVRASLSYPIFDFHYEDEEGWWSKKYEPLFKGDGANYKFTWWYEDGESRDEFLGGMMYGDVDFMRAWNGQGFEDSYGGHPVSLDDAGGVDEAEIGYGAELGNGGESKMAKRFRRLVLCSGPRDGINTFFMSDAHVCWAHSEAVRLSNSTLNKLAQMADDVYVMYDIDDTGVARANEIAVSCLKFKVIRLPMEMKDVISSRTKKPCKDASEYFSEYAKEVRDQSIRSHFEGLLVTAKSLKFWEKRASRQNTGNGGRVNVVKYEIINTNMSEFLPAVGMWRLTDESGMSKFVTMKDNRARVVQEAGNGVELTAISLLKDFIRRHHAYYHPRLEEAISVSTKISQKTLGQIANIRLDFCSYGEDFDYFFFKNGALRVDDKGWKLEPYTALKYAVNEEAILDWHWIPSANANGTVASNGMFEIEYNKAYVEAATRKHEEEVAAMTDATAIEKKKSDFKKHVTLWRYKLKWLKPVEECPPFVQYLWNCSRFFWEQEERGVELTPYQKQFCEIHFINKIGCIGYLLSRYRTSRRPYVVELTDYYVSDNSRDGRNGKSTLADLLLSMVRKICAIEGNTFKGKKEQIGLNFVDFKQDVHQLVAIDDLHRSFDFDLFVGLNRNVKIKTLYQNEITVDMEKTPKILISHNSHFLDSNKGGTYRGRLYSMYWSNYYHEASEDGKWARRTPETEFGDLTNMSDEEAQMTREMLAYALSFYLRENKTQGENVRIEAPLESADEIEQARKTLRDDTLWEWANSFFMKESHFKRPMARSTMCLDYMRYRNERLTPDKYVALNKYTLQKELVTFQQKIEQWCQLMKRMRHIVYNPVQVFREAPGFDSKANSNGTCMMRKDAWVYQMDDMHEEFDFNKPKVLMSDRCYYFYYEKDVPKSVEEILGASLKEED